MELSKIFRKSCRKKKKLCALKKTRKTVNSLNTKKHMQKKPKSWLFSRKLLKSCWVRIKKHGDYSLEYSEKKTILKNIAVSLWEKPMTRTGLFTRWRRCLLKVD